MWLERQWESVADPAGDGGGTLHNDWDGMQRAANGAGSGYSGSFLGDGLGYGSGGLHGDGFSPHQEVGLPLAVHRLVDDLDVWHQVELVLTLAPGVELVSIFGHAFWRCRHQVLVPYTAGTVRWIWFYGE